MREPGQPGPEPPRRRRASRRDEEDGDSADGERRSLARALVLAAVLSVPLLAVSMIGALQFDGWQWLAAALATPVVFVSGWRFHRTTVTNLRHGALTMDTLVSVGTLAAWTWSAVALLFLGAADPAEAGHAGMKGMDSGGGAHVYFETAGAMGFSSVFVVTNSLRLRRFQGYRRS